MLMDFEFSVTLPDLTALPSMDFGFTFYRCIFYIVICSPFWSSRYSYIILLICSFIFLIPCFIFMFFLFILWSRLEPRSNAIFPWFLFPKVFIATPAELGKSIVSINLLDGLTLPCQLVTAVYFYIPHLSVANTLSVIMFIFFKFIGILFHTQL